MNDVLVILADGFEETEAVVTIDVLRRMDLDVCIASLDLNTVVASGHKVKIVADCTLNDCKDKEFKAVVLPGGMPGSMNLRNSEAVMEIIRKTNERGDLVCSICAGAIALSQAGVLKNRKFTAYPGFEQYFETAPLTDMVVKDENVITGKGPGAAFDFALQIAEALGKGTYQIAQGMLLK